MNRCIRTLDPFVELNIFYQVSESLNDKSFLGIRPKKGSSLPTVIE